MTTFIQFRDAVNARIEQMTRQTMYRTSLNKEVLQATYLSAFLPGTDPIYKENTEHNCNCCMAFIRDIGGAVIINNDYELETIWDVEVGGIYQVVADTMATLVRGASVADMYLHELDTVGTKNNIAIGTGIQWDHFYGQLPDAHVCAHNMGGKLNTVRSCKEVFVRSMDSLTLESAETIIGMHKDGYLPRGDEQIIKVNKFIVDKNKYDEIDQKSKDNYAWVMATSRGESIKYRNTVIGTLMSDLSEGADTDHALESYAQKVDPTNYQRSSAQLTKRKVDACKRKVVELGLENSLHRRYAVIDDVSINNVLFADRSVTPQMKDVFDLIPTKQQNSSAFSSAQEIHIKDFIESVLPTVSGVELLVENQHKANFVSLIAPVYPDAHTLFKWGNNFSWSYNGEVTDSIKERVKKAGGSVTGVARVSLSWHNGDDLDIHVYEPEGNHIYFGALRNKYTGGELDVDMNAGSINSLDPVENITWPVLRDLQEGTYTVDVNNFTKRSSVNVGYTVQLELDGKIYNIHSNTSPKNKATHKVLTFTYSHADGFEVPNHTESTSSQTIWGVKTQEFIRVDTIMNSPNFWDGRASGNQHWFFMLEGCANPEESRGFYNEFLRDDLHSERKVFEMLGSTLRVEQSDKQLSGVGFSVNQRNHVVVRTTSDAANRTYKINF